ncbi:hypothetical protein TetV_309 [Tetraselmis virus 1]|uniref:Uncharacterized protein n=1 Tax=Tetraselmis virus 1 TaxID=2060617 RepID=A0A2P0VNB6_9VIRU|nr:hypothetical protein QJ968_gp309 [Tetraselmis virus 1]AUF82401.1 hypothetical protein TetV_309 [Tetraselmis virus 1]
MTYDVHKFLGDVAISTDDIVREPDLSSVLNDYKGPRITENDFTPDLKFKSDVWNQFISRGFVDESFQDFTKYVCESYFDDPYDPIRIVVRDIKEVLDDNSNLDDNGIYSDMNTLNICDVADCVDMIMYVVQNHDSIDSFSVTLIQEIFDTWKKMFDSGTLLPNVAQMDDCFTMLRRICFDINLKKIHSNGLEILTDILFSTNTDTIRARLAKFTIDRGSCRMYTHAAVNNVEVQLRNNNSDIINQFTKAFTPEIICLQDIQPIIIPAQPALPIPVLQEAEPVVQTQDHKRSNTPLEPPAKIRKTSNDSKNQPKIDQEDTTMWSYKAKLFRPPNNITSMCYTCRVKKTEKKFLCPGCLTEGRCSSCALEDGFEQFCDNCDHIMVPCVWANQNPLRGNNSLDETAYKSGYLIIEKISFETDDDGAIMTNPQPEFQHYILDKDKNVMKLSVPPCCKGVNNKKPNGKPDYTMDKPNRQFITHNWNNSGMKRSDVGWLTKESMFESRSGRPCGVIQSMLRLSIEYDEDVSTYIEYDKLDHTIGDKTSYVGQVMAKGFQKLKKQLYYYDESKM